VSLGERAILTAADDPALLWRVNGAIREAAGNTSVIQQAPILIQQPPIIVQQEAPTPPPIMFAPGSGFGAPFPPGVLNDPTAVPVSSAPPVGALLVTERAQRGFETDLLPEMARMLGSGVSRFQVAADIEKLIQEAFTSKNQLYNVLIRHQATFEGDEEYRKNLERLIQAWVADTVNSGG
jgi:hypothetical protein